MLFGKIGGPEIGIILLVVFVFFGPSIIRRFSSSVREMRKLSAEQSGE